LLRTDAADVLKRRFKQAGLPAHYSPHSFRATGITNFLENDGTPICSKSEIAANPSEEVSVVHPLHFSTLRSISRGDKAFSYLLIDGEATGRRFWTNSSFLGVEPRH
jgi:hypothetical protein